MKNPILHEKYKHLTDPELWRERAEALVEACKKGDIEDVKYLLTSPDLQTHADINEFLGSPLLKAAQNGHLEIVKYLLTSEDLKEKAEIILTPMTPACQGGHLHIVQYFLTDNKFKGRISIHGDKNDDTPFSWACANDHVELVKYLLFSNELDDHVDIHNHQDNPFKSAILGKALEVLRYFIFDLNIEKTKEITEYLIENPNEEIEKMFEARGLHKELKNELNSNDNNQKKNKI